MWASLYFCKRERLILKSERPLSYIHALLIRKKKKGYIKKNLIASCFSIACDEVLFRKNRVLCRCYPLFL